MFRPGAECTERSIPSHSMHHVLAIYGLGASPQLIRDVLYRRHLPRLLPALASPGSITEENFADHLGDEKYVSSLLYIVAHMLSHIGRYYDGYLEFFTGYLQRHSPIETLEKFIFSPAYNFGEKQQPQMLNRLLAGLLHPLIHLAYGIEFGILGQVVEGTYPS